MTQILVYLLANAASIFCLVVAFYMVINDINGWGWFLFIAICLTTSFKKKPKS